MDWLHCSVGIVIGKSPKSKCPIAQISPPLAWFFHLVLWFHTLSNIMIEYWHYAVALYSAHACVA
jgi:hypothetical protein